MASYIALRILADGPDSADFLKIHWDISTWQVTLSET